MELKQQEEVEKQFEKVDINEESEEEAKGEEQVQEEQEEEKKGKSKWEIIEEPKQTVPLFMVDFEHCDAKKCTGKKMERFKLLTSIKDKKKKFRGIVLSAFAKKTIHRDDLEHIKKGGICVIDCSWNRIEETKEFRYKHERKLPFVVAGNPVNFGKPYQLSCAEALATALCAVGFVPQAKYIMSKFGWADGFWKENPYLPLYGDCLTMEEVEKQSKINEQSRTVGFQRDYVLPESSSEEDNECVKIELKQE